MLTRLEISGFKTFEEFSIDIPPFLVILGLNNSGKSNIFDAIHFLSRVADSNILDALKSLRGLPSEIFRRCPDGQPQTTMCFAVEVLLDPFVRDPWGQTVKLTHTRVRYEIDIEQRVDEAGVQRLFVNKEAAHPILRKNDFWRPYGTNVSSAFRKAFLSYSKNKEFISTIERGGQKLFSVRQDGKQGRNLELPAVHAEATVLSSMTSAQFPHMFALREELRSWRLFQFDPAALRKPSEKVAPDLLAPDGANLASVLNRLRSETGTKEDPEGALTDISVDLASIIPGVARVSVKPDDYNREYQIEITTYDGGNFSSRVISDGTLRVLALLTLLHDPKNKGLLCFEEPENGVHPARLKSLIGYIQELVSDPLSNDIEPDDRLSQMIVNSHSPVVLSQTWKRHQAVFVDIVTAIDPNTHKKSKKTRVRPIQVSAQDILSKSNSYFVSRHEVDLFLRNADTEPDS